MKKYKQLMNEARAQQFQVYHPSLTSAIQAVEKYAKDQGYTLDDEQMAMRVGLGPAKPKAGKTTRYQLSVYDKDGNEIKKKLNAQVYNRGVDGNTYELNVYIS